MVQPSNSVQMIQMNSPKQGNGGRRSAIQEVPTYSNPFSSHQKVQALAPFSLDRAFLLLKSPSLSAKIEALEGLLRHLIDFDSK